MLSKKMIHRVFIVFIALLFISGSASASGLAAPLGTSFTYQGRLTDGGSPANGSYDFQFKLYDALTDGVLVGTDPLEDVVVSGGLFTVQLDFGPVFDGRVLYLEIAVRPAGGTTYTTLTPRQALSPTPYAYYALQSADAERLEGQPGSYYLDAGNINAGTLSNSRFSAWGDLTAEERLLNLAGSLAQNNGILQPTLNADLLDGLHASSFLYSGSPLNASDISSGTLGNSFFDAYGNLDANHHLDNLAGNLARNNGTLQPTLNADLLDGYHYNNLPVASHNHWGGTWTGSGTGLTLSGGTTGLSGSGSTYGVSGNATGPAGYGLYGTGATGVYGNSSAISGTGVYGETVGTNSTGVYGHSTGTGNSYGVYGNGPTGVYGFSNTTGGYGIYGKALSGAGTNYAGYFDGNVQINGNLNVTGTTNFNADQLDGQHGTYYLNAGNINAGTLGTGYFSAYSDLGAEGYLGNAAADLALNNGTLQATLNADLLDSHEATYFLNATSPLSAGNVNTGMLGNSFFDAYNNLSTAGYLGDAIGDLARNNGTLQATLNADMLDGHESTFFLNGTSLLSATNISTGMLGNSFFDAYNNLSTAGYLGDAAGDLARNNGTLQATLNADLLDGHDSTFFLNATSPLSASNISSGTLGNSFFDAYGNLGAGGYLGSDLGDLALVGHNHWNGSWSGAGVGLTLSGGTEGLHGSGSNYGVYGAGTGSGYGVYGTSSSSYGVYGNSTSGTGVLGAGGTGVQGNGVNGVSGYSNSSTGYGIYGHALNGANNNWAGYFDGNVQVNGNLNVSGTANLNADRLDNLHAGHATGNIPINDGAVNTSLNADLVDGFNAGNASGSIPVSNGTLNTNLNADKLDNYHASDFVLASAANSHTHWGQTWTGSGTGLTLSGGTTGISGSGSTYGLYGEGGNTGVSGIGTVYGVYGESNGGSYSTGLYGSSNPGTGVEGVGSVGVHGASGIGGKAIWGYASGGPNNNYAGYFDGNVQINGSLGITSSTLVTNLNADMLDGLHAASFWKLGGNSGTNPPTDFLGTLDNLALVLRVNNVIGWRLVPSGTNTPSVVGGYSGNSVTNGVIGGTIGGGGASGGSPNIVTDDYGVVGGGMNNQAGDNAGTTSDRTHATVSGGLSNTASGLESTVGGGFQNAASGSYASVPGGVNAYATHYGETAHASGKFSYAGDAQASEFILRNWTTDATQTELFLDGSGLRLTLATGRGLSFDILITAHATTGPIAAGYEIQGVIDNDSGNTRLIGAPTITVLGEDVPAWDATVVADNANDALVIKVTGAAGTSIKWVASVRVVQVGW